MSFSNDNPSEKSCSSGPWAKYTTKTIDVKKKNSKESKESDFIKKTKKQKDKEKILVDELHSIS